MLKDTIRELCLLDGVSSFEENVRAYIKAAAAPYADEMRVDPLGTLIVFKKGKKSTGSKLLLAAFTPLEIMTFRFVIAWTVLLLLSPHPIRPKGLRGELPFLGAGLTGLTLYFILENTALEYTLASNVGIIISAAPMFSALLLWAFHRTGRLRPHSGRARPAPGPGRHRPHPAGPVALPAALIHKKYPPRPHLDETGILPLDQVLLSALSSASGSTTTGSSAGASTVSSVQPQPQPQSQV